VSAITYIATVVVAATATAADGGHISTGDAGVGCGDNRGMHYSIGPTRK
jgi:hypothetical protein